ncbi:MAG: MFS transporter [Anaerolineae bacterium]|nr:MFS transporter [Anaerolineae bacterium]
MTNDTNRELTLLQKIGYGLGDIYGGGAGTLISFYYLVFLTDVVRIRPGLAGTVILISKVYDAITDPFEGVIADRTRTRMGRRRPYLLAGVPLVFLSFFALFYPTSLPSETSRFLFVVATYLFFSTIVSIVMLNYNALQSELTLDYNERTVLSSVRIFFSTIGSIAAALVPLEIVGAFDSVRTGYVAMGLTFGAIFALPFIATVLTTRERSEFQRPPQPFDWRKTYLQPFQTKTFVMALLMYLLAFVAIDAVSSIVVYYMKYHLLRGGEVSFVNGTLLVAQVVSLPFYSWLSRHTSKRTGYMVGAGIWMAAMVVSGLITPASPAWAVYVFASIVGIGTGGIVVMIYAIFPDIPDVDELATGERREGTYSALITFVRKFSSAVAIFLVSNALAVAGYIPPVEELANGRTRLIEQAQSPAFITTLRWIFAGVPIALLAVALVFASRYPLSPEAHARLRHLLAACRRSDALSPQERREVEVLKARLIGEKG